VWEVTDSVETAASVILQDLNDSPVAVHTISGDALLSTGMTVTSSSDRAAATQAYGAGWNTALTAGKGLKIIGASASEGSVQGRVRFFVDQ
jgi:hypothetical protein